MPIILIIIALIIGLGGGYVVANKTMPASHTSNVNSASDSAAEIKLPADAVKLSPCIPHMGFHWGAPDSLGFGPTFNVWNGKVVGIEYHLDFPALSTFSKPAEPFTPFLFNKTYDHFVMNAVPTGHGGKPTPHWDIHIMTISRAEAEKITCIGEETPTPKPATNSATTTTPVK